MSNGKTSQPQEPERVKAFVRFFKRYMSISSLVVASLPIPITASGAIPTYKAQTLIFSVYTPLFCFLLLGFIFYNRHQLAGFMFPRYLGNRPILARIYRLLAACLPAVLIAASMFCAFRYIALLNDSVLISRAEIVLEYLRNEHELTDTRVMAANKLLSLRNEPSEARRIAIARNVLISFPLTVPKGVLPQAARKKILAHQEQQQIPFAKKLMLYHIAIFLSAEAAFILMAIKEYLQDLLGLTELDLIIGPSAQRNEISH